MIDKVFYTVVIKLSSLANKKMSKLTNVDRDGQIVGINYTNWADVKKQIAELEAESLKDSQDFTVFHGAENNFKNKYYEVVNCSWVSCDTKNNTLVYKNAI